MQMRLYETAVYGIFRRRCRLGPSGACRKAMPVQHTWALEVMFEKSVVLINVLADFRNHAHMRTHNFLSVDDFPKLEKALAKAQKKL